MMNRLSQESSLYLQQHARNPVDWWPWGEEALETAQKLDRPIILSIGYSSCHWCHVMEKESFESHEVAELMNSFFVPIKLDREERPDVDQIYMEALHLMGLRGGWPLNVFLFPDGKPFYGGTYFPKDHWIHLLLQVRNAWQKNREELRKSAEGFTKGLVCAELDLSLQFKINFFDQSLVEQAFETLAQKFDLRYGGLHKAPKFPMPSIWEFLNVYAYYNPQTLAPEALHKTLKGMAYGGIYDALGGGFARYSTDSIWLVPHFEKMLYDNAQLLELYAHAYQATQEPLYLEVIKETTLFLEAEMRDDSGAFFSSIDADSQGEEGKFYVWTEAEIDEILLEQSPFFKEYYGIKAEGNWEEHKNILHRLEAEQEFAQRKGIDPKQWNQDLNHCKSRLFAQRAKRVRPTTDKKILTAWNGLTVSALSCCYRATGDSYYLELAVAALDFIRLGLIENDKVLHLYHPNRKEYGFLDDYATVAAALMDMYQTTFDERLLYQAKTLIDKAINEFYDPQDGLFFYTASSSQSLIARKKELFDNVIPASNSMMARALRKLGKLLAENRYIQLSTAMLEKVAAYLPNHIEYMANWGLLYLENLYGDKEIAITGSQALSLAKSLNLKFLPGVVICAAPYKSNLPLLHQRFDKEKTLIYVCQNKTCSLPTESLEQAFELIKS
jgi:uncharacterized protein YyaL (SSP411 family)